MGGIANVLPNLKVLNECFDANFVRGILIWKVRPISHFINAATAKKINAKFSGKIAGSISEGYYKVKIFGRMYPVHRILYYMCHNIIDINLEIDHINHNKQDNSINNLRLVTSLINNNNKQNYNNNTTGIRGIYWHKINKKWQASIGHNKKNIYIGSYNNFEDAVRARENAELQYSLI